MAAQSQVPSWQPPPFVQVNLHHLMHEMYVGNDRVLNESACCLPVPTFSIRMRPCLLCYVADIHWGIKTGTAFCILYSRYVLSTAPEENSHR